jgi:hypothetical protein
MEGGPCLSRSHNCWRDEKVESKNLGIQALLAQMRANIKDPKRRIRLHDLKLLGIFVKEIAVSEKDVHGDGLTRENVQ